MLDSVNCPALLWGALTPVLAGCRLDLLDRDKAQALTLLEFGNDHDQSVGTEAASP